MLNTARGWSRRTKKPHSGGHHTEEEFQPETVHLPPEQKTGDGHQTVEEQGRPQKSAEGHAAHPRPEKQGRPQKDIEDRGQEEAEFELSELFTHQRHDLSVRLWPGCGHCHLLHTSIHPALWE